MDFLLSIGMRPFVELSFMPETLASGRDSLPLSRQRHASRPSTENGPTLIANSPATGSIDMALGRCVNGSSRSGTNPISAPSGEALSRIIFTSTAKPPPRLKRVDPALWSADPPRQPTNGSRVSRFLHCQQVPVDFISTHHYPTDAFGMTGTDTMTQLDTLSCQCHARRRHPSAAQAPDLPLYYTDGTLIQPSRSLSRPALRRCLCDKDCHGSAGLVQGYSYWTFSDIFEENYFPSVPFHGGFGLLNIYGMPNRSTARSSYSTSSDRSKLRVEGVHSTVNVWVVREKHAATILLTNLAMPRHTSRRNWRSIALRRAAPSERVDRAYRRHTLQSAWTGTKWVSRSIFHPAQVDQLEMASRLDQGAALDAGVRRRGTSHRRCRRKALR